MAHQYCDATTTTTSGQSMLPKGRIAGGRFVMAEHFNATLGDCVSGQFERRRTACGKCRLSTDTMLGGARGKPDVIPRKKVSLTVGEI